MMKKALSLLLGAIVIIAVIPTLVAQEAASTLAVTEIDDTEYPTLRLFVEGTAPQAYDTLLTVNDFNVTIGDSSVPIQAIEGVRNDELPINVVLVIDTSQSMFDVPLNSTKQAVDAFLARLNPEDQVALIGFADRARLIRGFEANPSALQPQVNALGAIGRTALYDAVSLAAETAAQAPSDRTVIVFLTDGNEFGGLSASTATQALENSQATNVPFFVIGLGYDVDSRFLTNVAESTSGDYYESPTPDELAEVYDLLASYLRTEYVLTITPDVVPDGEAITVNVAQGADTASIAYQTPDLLPQIDVANLPDGVVEAATDLQVTVNTPRGFGAPQQRSTMRR